jgi:hypothetical protein
MRYRLIKSGIYLISYNNINLYVGSSKDIITRIKRHISDLKSKHPNEYLRAFLKKNKLKASDLTFSCLQIVKNPSDLLIEEQYFQNTLLPICNVLPADLSAASPTFKLLTYDKIHKKAKALSFGKIKRA